MLWEEKTETHAYGEGYDSPVAPAATTTLTRDSRDVSAIVIIQKRKVKAISR